MAHIHKLIFDIRSYWHAGTGQGSGSHLDAIVQKDSHGLPILPGRSVKGLLRDAVLQAEQLDWFSDLQAPSGSDSPTELLFGKKPSENSDQEGHDPGLLRIGSATLPAEMVAWLSEDIQASYRTKLFREMHSTAIDEKTGTALDKSLRGIEVTIPLILEAPLSIQGESDWPWQEYLKMALPLLRHIGSKRNRGMGRVIVTLGA